jgi:Cu(I)/Ag(I) efflux system periplasmic protein CusF
LGGLVSTGALSVLEDPSPVLNGVLMKSIAYTLFLSAALSTAAFAQTPAANPAPTAAASAADLTDGEVRRVDKSAAKITLRHGEIKSLEMPPMTMVFQVKDPGLLDKLKVGDKVKFRAEKSGSSYIVTAIEAAP